MAPRQRFLLIAVVALAAIAISAQVALSSPWLGLELSPHDGPEGLRVDRCTRIHRTPGLFGWAA